MITGTVAWKEAFCRLNTKDTFAVSIDAFTNFGVEIKNENIFDIQKSIIGSINRGTEVTEIILCGSLRG